MTFLTIHHPPSTIHAFLAQATYTYKPFVTPLPAWDAWFWLLVPLCIGVAVVYKSAKCRSAGDVPREAGLISVWILTAMIGAALLLVAVTWVAAPR